MSILQFQTFLKSLSSVKIFYKILNFTLCLYCTGKRVDVIRKVLEDAFNEVSWRQPSVILLDDLDQVTRAPLGPEEEMGPEAAFNAHVAQGKL